MLLNAHGFVTTILTSALLKVRNGFYGKTIQGVNGKI